MKNNHTIASTIYIAFLFLISVFTTSSAYALSDTSPISDITVSVLQTFLMDKGLLVITPTDTLGFFGPKTKKALMSYQQSVGLSAEGVFGPQTKAKIAAELSVSVNTQPSSVAALSPSSQFVTETSLTSRLQPIYKMIADSQRINQLSNVAITGGTITGASISGSSGGSGGTGGGVSSINSLSDATQTFATSTDANIGLSIVSSGSVHTFTPSWAGTLSVARGGTAISTPTAAGVLVGNYLGTGYQQIATSSLGLLTTNVAEGSNLYFTTARVDAQLAATTTLPNITTLSRLASVGTAGATTTFAGGISLSSGCVSVGSGCIGGGASAAGSFSELQYRASATTFGAITNSGPVPTANWVLRNCGSSAARCTIDDFSAKGVNLYMSPQASSVQFGIATQALSAAPYTVIAQMQYVGQAVSGQSLVAGLFLYDGTKAYSIELLDQTAQSIEVETRQLTSLTQVSGGTTAGVTLWAIGKKFTVKVVDDGVHRTWYYWANGAWVQQLQETTGTFLTPNAVGIGGLVNGGGSPMNIEVSYWCVSVATTCNGQ